MERERERGGEEWGGGGGAGNAERTGKEKLVGVISRGRTAFRVKVDGNGARARLPTRACTLPMSQIVGRHRAEPRKRRGIASQGRGSFTGPNATPT